MSHRNTIQNGDAASLPATVATVATVGGEHGAATPATAATDDGLHLLDVARDVVVSVLETTQMEHGVTVQATNDAVRILLLAAAELVSPIELVGHALPVSLALRQALDETLAAYAEPIIATGDLDQLSDRELDARAASMDAAADTHQAHADELRRFQAERQATAGEGPVA